MTDEERQKLCEALRGYCWSFHAEEAADEIERLASIVADYKMVFGDIHKIELAEMKVQVEGGPE